MKKTIMAIVLASALALCATACGNNDTAETATLGDSEAVAETTAEAADEAETEAVAEEETEAAADEAEVEAETEAAAE